ncbi:Membrane proteins related to metalloendopeptidases [hydrothermal vent metagenome]|uniref:Membrane proteins related to metalloendopeptidases n=1 Tax=hydrothermal vent metagenome TaxID=652676 RepID=A0A1W1EIH3_9ZZZZ
MFNKKAFEKREKDRNKHIITIHDKNGIRQVTVGYFAKRLFLLVISIIIIIIFISFLYTKYLEDSFIELQSIHKNTEIEITKLKLQQKNIIKYNNELKSIIITKEKQKNNLQNTISSLGEELENTKNILGINDDGFKINSKIDYSKLSISEKEVIMHNIPNGKPVSIIKRSSGFGWRIHPILHRRVFHRGLDISVSIGTKVMATANGIIEKVRYNKHKGYGNLLIIKHSYGFRSAYAHLNSIDVKVGDYVLKGQVVARSGNTGRSTGPHLHYEVRYLDKILNPNLFIKWNLNNFTNTIKKENRVQWHSVIKATKTTIHTVQQALLLQERKLKER